METCRYGNGTIGKVQCGNEFIEKVQCGNETIGKVQCGNETIGKVQCGNEFIGKVQCGNEASVKRTSRRLFWSSGFCSMSTACSLRKVQRKRARF